MAILDEPEISLAKQGAGGCIYVFFLPWHGYMCQEEVVLEIGRWQYRGEGHFDSHALLQGYFIIVAIILLCMWGLKGLAVASSCGG